MVGAGRGGVHLPAKREPVIVVVISKISGIMHRAGGRAEKCTTACGEQVDTGDKARADGVQISVSRYRAAAFPTSLP